MVTHADEVTSCGFLGSDEKIPTLAWGEFDQPAADIAAEIQICPWFLQYATIKRFKTIKDTSVTALLATAAIPTVQLLGIYAEVDAFSLLDKVLLHEMTHLFVNHHAEDVRAPFAGRGLHVLIFKCTT